MDRYRITYVNVAFAPKASHLWVSATSHDDAVVRFWREVNPSVVVRTAGRDGIVAVDRHDELNIGPLCPPPRS